MGRACQTVARRYQIHPFWSLQRFIMLPFLRHGSPQIEDGSSGQGVNPAADRQPRNWMENATMKVLISKAAAIAAFTLFAFAGTAQAAPAAALSGYAKSIGGATSSNQAESVGYRHHRGGIFLFGGHGRSYGHGHGHHRYM